MNLHQYCAALDLAEIKSILDAGADANSLDTDGLSPLHILASRSESIECIKLIIERGGNVNLKGHTEGISPIHLSCFHQRRDITSFLLDNGADVNCASSNGQTPTHVACTKSDTETLQILLDKGADVHMKTSDVNTPLHLACFANSAKCCEMLIRGGSNVNEKNRFGSTSLHWACKSDSTEVALMLLRENADHTILNKVNNFLALKIYNLAVLINI